MHKINKYSACTLCVVFDVFKIIITTCLTYYHCDIEQLIRSLFTVRILQRDA